MADRFAVNVTGTVSWDGTNTAIWSATDGGASGASVPTVADNVKVTALSGTGTLQISTVDGVCLNIDTTGFTGTLTAASGIDLNIAGSCTWGAGMTLDFPPGTGGFLFNGAGTHTVTCNGITFDKTIEFNGTGSWAFQDAFLSSQITLTQGTLDFNDQAVLCDKLRFNGTATRSLLLGNGTITIDGADGGSANTRAIAADVTTGLTFNAEGSTIKFTDASATSKTIGAPAAGLAFNNVWFSGSGVGDFVILGDCSFADIKSDTAAHEILVEDGRKITIASLTWNAAVTVDSLNGGAQHQFFKTSGSVTITGATLRRSYATGGATFNAQGCVDGGDNSGWLFGEKTGIIRDVEDRGIARSVARGWLG